MRRATQYSTKPCLSYKCRRDATESTPGSDGSIILCFTCKHAYDRGRRAPKAINAELLAFIEAILPKLQDHASWVNDYERVKIAEFATILIAKAKA